MDQSYEAKFIKDTLANEGIACIITNENFTTLMPLLNGMLGAGIQILVDIDNIDRARQILAKGNTKEVHVCPNCSSTNLTYGFGTRHRTKKILAFVIALLTASPVRFIKKKYYCRDCKTEFGSTL